jgi:endoglucanase
MQEPIEMTRLAHRHLLPFGVLVAIVVGCVAPGARNVGSLALKECGPDGLIDDFEDGNSRSAMIGGRGGYWYAYVDKQGSTITPSGTFESEEGGRDASKYVAEMKGKLAGSSIVYAGIGMDFTSPKVAYDASKYEGITFFAKRAPNTMSKLTVKLPDIDTDPDGKVCTECYNDFNYTIDVGEQWQRYVLVFRDLRQEGAWGAPRKPHIDPHKLFAIHWEAKTSGGDYDFFIDDIAFVCGG